MPTFGEIADHPEGSIFQNRAELKAAGLHSQNQAGISGSSKEGADAIVLNEGYEDDNDLGNEVIYTGQAGRDPNSGNQIADQQLERGNIGLVTSCLRGHQVRVIRGPKLRSPYAPKRGYRYDGLYNVEDYWWETGKSGYRIIRFRLRKADSARGQTSSTITRVIRDTKIGHVIKELYDYTCQVCGTRLECEGGPYAEAAHIRPLSRPHDGPDSMTNVICLCPNHRVLFRRGGFTIADDFSLVGLPGSLTVHEEHAIDKKQLEYHRGLFPF